MQQPPRVEDMVTREGREVAIEWTRREVRRRLPVSIRRRLLPLYHRWQSGA